MRGGISYISKRFNKGNNKYMKSYDDKNQVNILHIWKQMIYMAWQ